MQVSPLSQQNFEGAKFFKIPDEMQQVLLKDHAFNNLAKEYDIFVSALPKRTLKDPLRLRCPKPEEKCYLTCEMRSIEDETETFVEKVTTKSKFLAPLKEHIESLREVLRHLDFNSRVSNLFYGMKD